MSGGRGERGGGSGRVVRDGGRGCSGGGGVGSLNGADSDVVTSGHGAEVMVRGVSCDMEMEVGLESYYHSFHIVL